MKEYEKMINELIYDCQDDELVELRERCQELSKEFNKLGKKDYEKKKEILKELCPHVDPTCYFTAPIQFDYGINTYVGENTYFNFNLTILDCANVYIGKNCFFGPNVTIVTPMHSLLKEERRMFFNKEKNHFTDNEWAKSIKIGDDCWIASNVIICGGVKIGNGVTIGAGSVVTKDIEDNVLACGNPCKVIRKIDEKDSIKHKNLF